MIQIHDSTNQGRLQIQNYSLEFCARRNISNIKQYVSDAVFISVFRQEVRKIFGTLGQAILSYCVQKNMHFVLENGSGVVFTSTVIRV
jgi:hypothetical protein